MPRRVKQSFNNALRSSGNGPAPRIFPHRSPAASSISIRMVSKIIKAFIVVKPPLIYPQAFHGGVGPPLKSGAE
jgi:hypothetical protein